MLNISPWQLHAVLGLWMAVQMLTCVDTDELEQTVAQAVTKAMQWAGLTTKELADVMRIDESQLRKQLRGEKYQHLSLSRLCRAWQLWPMLGPAILFIVAQRRWAEVLADVTRKA